MRQVCLFVCLLWLGLACSKCIGPTFKPASMPAEAACTPLTTRCYHEFVEICDSDRRWSPIIDCMGIIPSEWRCGLDDGRHLCLHGMDGGAE